MNCWIGVGPACPTRPPHQQGTELVDELEDLRLCESEVLSQSAISGTMVLSYHGKDYRQPAEVFGRKECGLSLFGMSNYELALSSKQME